MTNVKKLEQELNVSRVSLYAILKKSPFDAHVTKGENNVILVDDAGVEMLRDYYFKKIRGGALRKNVAAAANSGEINIGDGESVISILQEQLTKKDEQINSLLSIVRNQQKLNA